MAIFTETKFTEWAEPIPGSEVHPPCSTPRFAIVPEPAEGDETRNGEDEDEEEEEEEEEARERDGGGYYRERGVSVCEIVLRKDISVNILDAHSFERVGTYWRKVGLSYGVQTILTHRQQARMRVHTFNFNRRRAKLFVTVYFASPPPNVKVIDAPANPDNYSLRLLSLCRPVWKILSRSSVILVGEI